MAWTTPMTAVANTEFTAAQFNTHLRDNLNETAPAKALSAGGLIVTDGANSVIQRNPTWSFDSTTSLTTTSTTYVTLNGGPAVTVTTGTAAIVYWATQIQSTNSGNTGRASIAVSGATSIAAQDDWAIYQQADANTRLVRFGGHHVFDTLNAGSNTFTMRHLTSGESTFGRRIVTVIPL